MAEELVQISETSGSEHVSQWGMAIDLDRCTGCEACVVACHAENNIPLSDETSAEQGRATNWIRIDRYYEGEFPNVKVRYQPVMCQQCDDAPCEPVCPVFATYQNPEGLNVQVHSRCVGTRYCANNCPYTVRYFNWSEPVWPDSLKAQLNPDVSIRPGGVMEKCTFCTQRIRRGQEDAAVEGREVADGDIQPACAQSCPAEAMVFGDLSDRESKVSQWANRGRSTQLLGELGTKPRVFYLQRGE